VQIYPFKDNGFHLYSPLINTRQEEKKIIIDRNYAGTGRRLESLGFSLWKKRHSKYAMSET
jgi:hypothetical protein